MVFEFVLSGDIAIATIRIVQKILVTSIKFTIGSECAHKLKLATDRIYNGNLTVIGPSIRAYVIELHAFA
jgi:hypothetical protein